MRQGDKMKATIIVKNSLPLGLIANATAVLGVSLGAMLPEIVGPDLLDGSGDKHPGITGTPIPVLQAAPQKLANLAKEAHDKQVKMVGFTGVAQQSKSYEEYERKLQSMDSLEIDYLAVLLVGDKGHINRLTGSLPLLGQKQTTKESKNVDAVY